MRKKKSRRYLYLVAFVVIVAFFGLVLTRQESEPIIQRSTINLFEADWQQSYQGAFGICSSTGGWISVRTHTTNTGLCKMYGVDKITTEQLGFIDTINPQLDIQYIVTKIFNPSHLYGFRLVCNEGTSSEVYKDTELGQNCVAT